MLNHPVIITPLRTYLYGQANFWMEVICIQYLLMEYLEKDNFLKIANANFIFACAKLIIKLHYVFNLCVRTIMWLVCRFGAPTKMAQLFSIPASLLTNAEELNSSWSFWRKFSEAWLSGTFESTTHHDTWRSHHLWCTLCDILQKFNQCPEYLQDNKMHQFLYSDLSVMKKQMEEEIRAQLEANMSNMMSWDEKVRNEKQGNSHSLTKISVRSLTKPVANFFSVGYFNPSQPFPTISESYQNKS